jgi:hypothetical protein
MWISTVRDNEPRPRRSGMEARRPRMELRRRRRATGLPTGTAPMRVNGSRKCPLDCATRRVTPRARPQDCQSATMSLVLEGAAQRERQCRIMMLEHDGDRSC